MSEDREHSYGFKLTDHGLKRLRRVAALLELEEIDIFRLAFVLVCDHAEACIEGKTEVVYCSPSTAATVKNNPKFIEALCEEGVVEWLTPFVLTKSKQGD